MTLLAQNINTAFSETGSMLDGYVSSQPKGVRVG
jgi:hypothetical protein